MKIELSTVLYIMARLVSFRLAVYFNATVSFVVTGKRKREIELVVPARFSAATTELRIADVLERELSSKAMKCSHFELNNITIQKKKFPRLV